MRSGQLEGLANGFRVPEPQIRNEVLSRFGFRVRRFTVGAAIVASEFSAKHLALFDRINGLARKARAAHRFIVHDYECWDSDASASKMRGAWTPCCLGLRLAVQ